MFQKNFTAIQFSIKTHNMVNIVGPTVATVAYFFFVVVHIMFLDGSSAPFTICEGCQFEMNSLHILHFHPDNEYWRCSGSVYYIPVYQIKHIFH